MLSAVQGVGHRTLARSKECSDFLALFCMGLVIAVGIGGDRGRERTQERSLILPSRKPVIFIAYLRLEFLHTVKSRLNTQGKPQFLELDPSAVQVGYVHHEDHMENSSATTKLFSPQGALTRALRDA